MFSRCGPRTRRIFAWAQQLALSRNCSHSLGLGPPIPHPSWAFGAWTGTVRVKVIAVPKLRCLWALRPPARDRLDLEPKTVKCGPILEALLMTTKCYGAEQCFHAFTADSHGERSLAGGGVNSFARQGAEEEQVRV